MQRSSVVLPLAAGADEDDDLGARHVHVDAAQDLRLAEALVGVETRTIGSLMRAIMYATSVWPAVRLPMITPRDERLRSFAVADGEDALQLGLEDAEDGGHRQVPDGGDDEQFHDLEVDGVDQVRSAEQLDEADREGDASCS